MTAVQRRGAELGRTRSARKCTLKFIPRLNLGGAPVSNLWVINICSVIPRDTSLHEFNLQPRLVTSDSML